MYKIKLMTKNQKGFSQLILVGLIAAGIIAGTLLVENGANFFSKAAGEQEGLYPSAGATKNCDSETDKEKCIAENNEICRKDEVVYCDNRSGSPRAIRKSGGYYDPKDPNTDPASGCVFDYWEISSKNSECGKTESKSGDVVYTTEEESERLDEERAKTLPERQKQAGVTSSGQSSAGTTACTPAANTAYYDAKVANNLARFYAIKNGAGGLCVPADLGVPTKDDVTVNGVEGRLMMCSSKDDPPKLYWMIASYKDNSLIAVPESQKPAPDANSIEKGFQNLPCARYKAGLDNNAGACKEG